MRRVATLVVPLALFAALGVAVFLRSRQPAEPPVRLTDPELPAPPPRTPSARTSAERPQPPRPPSEHAASMQVVVTGTNGPLPEAEVMIVHEPTHESYDRTTSATGECTFERIRPGEWLVVAQHRRHVPARQRVVVEEGRATMVALRLVEGGRAEGVVADASGRALSGAEVEILDADRRVKLLATLAARTDEHGRYVIEGIPLQRVGINARASRYKPVERYDLVFTVPGETQIHDFVLHLGSTVSGRVVNEGGIPVSDAVVTGGNELAAGVRTDRDGRFVITGLGDKPVSLSAGARGYGTEYLRNVAPNTEGVELRLYRGGRIEGRVSPVLDTFSVLFYRFEPDLGRELCVRAETVRAGQGGEFAIPDVARGAYELAVDAPGYQAVSRVKVSVSPGETVGGVVLEVRSKP
ncbi:MAG: carboxypeptidase regulatory-like domain-containing protein [Planctomycetes bacterium]|nr:carboxypeptidase regulatory-like domain-containing protein [Planctomycetota bacterium]